MANTITYYAIVTEGATADQPRGLLRRLEHDDGPEDEGLQKDMGWHRTSLIVEHEHGGSDEDLVQVSHEQASRIVEYLRERFARGATPQ
ncbi:MAG TPA: hypothetical protein VFW16_10240 [Streptosporangiaceae bacterium]|nr:hypothetical protein [Streptosporangiaceae bacterium]